MSRVRGVGLAQLAALGLAGLALLLGFIYLVLLWGSREAVLRVAETQRREIAWRMAARVEAYLGVGRHALASIEAQLRLGIADPDDPESVEALLLGELLRSGSLAEVTLTRADSRGFEPDGERSLAAAGRWQLSALREGGQIVTLYTRARGPGFVAERRVLAADAGRWRGAERLPPETAADPTQHLTFRTTASRRLEPLVARTGGALWTDLHYAERDLLLEEARRRAVVTAMKTVADEAGRFLGVARAGLDRAQLDVAMAAAFEDDTERGAHRLVLCDEHGRLLTRLEPGDALREEPDDALRVAPAALPAELAAALSEADLVALGEDRTMASSRFVASGRQWLATSLALAGSQDWRLLVLVPEDRYTGALEATRRRVAVAGIAVIALAVAGGALALRALRGSLGEIVARAGLIRELRFEAHPVRAVFSDVRVALEGLERAKTALRAMGRYVPVDLVRRLLESGREPSLGGELIEATVLFTDVEGFTSIAEELSPDELAGLLGRHLAALTGAVHAHDGVVDKYIGDSVMALWNAPAACPDHAAQACRAALAGQAALERLAREERSAGRPALRARIGLHSDRVLVGHFGAPDRMAYTALGDGVNLASRLEGLNRMYGTGIIVSDAVRERAGAGFVFRRLDRVAVKGRARSVTVLELVAEGEVPAEDEARIRRYERALDAYLARDFAAAEALLAGQPEDPPSAHLAERCRELARRPPAAGWDGSYVAREK